MSSHSIVAWKFSVKKFTYSFMGIPLYVTPLFSLIAFKMLSLSLDFVNLMIMYLGVVLFGFYLLESFGPHGSGYLSLSRFGKFSAIFSLNILFVPFSFSSPFGIHIIVSSHVSHNSYRLLYSFSFFLPFCFFDQVISSVLFCRLLILSSACWVYFWNSILSSSVWLVYFSLGFLFLLGFHFLFLLLFFMVSISLLNFSFCSHSIFLILFSCLYMFSCTSPNVLKKINLNYFSDSSLISTFFLQILKLLLLFIWQRDQESISRGGQ